MNTQNLITKEHGVFIWACTLVLFAVIAALDISISHHLFMITEGWWETYAWLGSQGHSLYESSGMKLAPLYTLLIGFAQKLFNFDYLHMRYLWVGVHLVAILVFYRWLRIYADVVSSLIATAFVQGLIMSNPVYLAKDYHTLVALLVYSTFYLLAKLELSSNACSKSNILIYFATGLLGGLLLITKQNIGVFFSFGVVLYLLLHAWQQENALIKPLKLISFYLLGYLIPALAVTYYDPNWVSIFIGNDAKGSIFTVLLRFALNISLAKYLIAVVVLLSVFFLFINTQRLMAVLDRVEAYVLSKHRRELFPVVFVLIIVAFSLKTHYLLFVFALTWPILRRYSHFPVPGADGITRRSPYLFLPLLGYAYCGTQTAGYNAVSMDVLVGLSVAELLSFLIYRLRINQADEEAPLPRSRYALLAPVVFFLVVAPKSFSPAGYDWWGLKAGGLLSSHQSLPFPELKGIHTDSVTASMFEQIKHYEGQYQAGEVFAHPSIPIVYSLLKTQPPGPPVLWFDVSTDHEAEKLLTSLQSKPPKVIFWLRPPGYVYHGHFMLRQADPAMTHVDNWIIHNLCNNHYKIAKTILAYNPKYNYETSGVKKPINFYHCAASIPDSEQEFTPISGYNYRHFIENTTHLLEVEDHVLYVLESND